jgi:hypothetical protein
MGSEIKWEIADRGWEHTIVIITLIGSERRAMGLTVLSLPEELI